jgi:hypothetical protein
MRTFKSPNDRRRTSFLGAAAGLMTVLAAVFVGCGDAPPLTPRGAWFVNFVDSGTNCQHADHNKMIGEISADSRTKLVDHEELLDPADPESGVSVSCSLIDDGSGKISFSAAESAAGPRILTLIVPELTAGATKDKPAKGTVAYTSAETAKTFNSTECNFYFLSGTEQALKPGQVWLTFDCPEFAAAIDDVCKLNIGYAAFENCKTENEDG